MLTFGVQSCFPAAPATALYELGPELSSASSGNHLPANSLMNSSWWFDISSMSERKEALPAASSPNLGESSTRLPLRC